MLSQTAMVNLIVDRVRTVLPEATFDTAAPTNRPALYAVVKVVSETERRFFDGDHLTEAELSINVWANRDNGAAACRLVVDAIVAAIDNRNDGGVWMRLARRGPISPVGSWFAGEVRVKVNEL